MLIPEDPIQRTQLQVEADFYQIKDIIEQLSSPVPFIHVSKISLYTQDRTDKSPELESILLEIGTNQKALDLLPPELIYHEDKDVWDTMWVDNDILMLTNKKVLIQDIPSNVENAHLTVRDYLSRQIGWKLVSSKTYPSAGTFRPPDYDNDLRLYPNNTRALQLYIVKEDKWEKQATRNLPDLEDVRSF